LRQGGENRVSVFCSPSRLIHRPSRRHLLPYAVVDLKLSTWNHGGCHIQDECPLLPGGCGYADGVCTKDSISAEGGYHEWSGVGRAYPDQIVFQSHQAIVACYSVMVRIPD